MVRRHRKNCAAVRIHRNNTDILRTVFGCTVVLIGPVFVIEFLNILFYDLLNIQIQRCLDRISILRHDRLFLILLIFIEVSEDSSVCPLQQTVVIGLNSADAVPDIIGKANYRTCHTAKWILPLILLLKINALHILKLFSLCLCKVTVFIQ